METLKNLLSGYLSANSFWTALLFFSIVPLACNACPPVV
jgi:hypothetical protein